MQPPAPLTPAAAKALEGLTDISMPQPVSWMPQTWGWAVLAGLLTVMLAWTLWKVHRHREANRYRAEALAALAGLSPRLDDPGSRAAALGDIGVLLKRTALAVFPRDEVADLSGARWVAFLDRHGRATMPARVSTVLDDLEYQRPDALAAISAEQAREVLDAARMWVKEHHVPA